MRLDRTRHKALHWFGAFISFYTVGNIVYYFDHRMYNYLYVAKSNGSYRMLRLAAPGMRFIPNADHSPCANRIPRTGFDCFCRSDSYPNYSPTTHRDATANRDSAAHIWADGDHLAAGF